MNDVTTKPWYAGSQECLDYLGITSSRWGHSRTGQVILKLIKDYNISSFVEVGSQTSYLSELVAKKYPNIMVYCIDLCFHRPHIHKEYSNLSQIVSDSVEATSEFENKSMDLVYIDADHTYEAVKNDLAAWYPKCRTVLAGHDYNQPDFPECTTAIEEFLEEHQSLNIKTGDYYNWWVEL